MKYARRVEERKDRKSGCGRQRRREGLERGRVSVVREWGRQGVLRWTCGWLVGWLVGEEMASVVRFMFLHAQFSFVLFSFFSEC